MSRDVISFESPQFIMYYCGFLRSVTLLCLLTQSFLAAKVAMAVPELPPAVHKIQVCDPVIGAQIVERGGRLLADYGSYQLYESANVGSTWTANPRVEIKDDYYQVMLNAGWLDTRLAAVQALRTPHADFTGRQLHLVQFIGPVQPAWRDELLAAGVQIVNYLPENAYLIYGDAASIARVQANAATNPHFQWDGKYVDTYKIDPGALMVDAKGNPRVIGTDLFAIQFVADSEGNTNSDLLIQSLQLEPPVRHERVMDYVNVIVRLSPENLALIAAQPEVISIQPYFMPVKFDERQDQIIAGNLSGNVPASPGYLAWLASKGFTQAQFTSSGFAVDISDSGVDNGTTSPNHFGLYLGGTVGGTSRIIYNRLVGTPNSGSSLQGCDGHGNLNTHIISGYDDSTGFPFADSSGYHFGLGVCPFVKMGSSVIFDPSNFTSPTYSSLSSQAYQNGSRICNNSWGANTAGAYNTDAQSYDALVRDAQPAGSTVPAAGNQELIFVFAAGNAGSGTKTVGSPGTAKNVITVGAGENVQAFGGADASGVTDSQANSANDIVSFSSRGPCADGRHKPEISAPGTHVSGGVAQASSPGATGTAIACFNGSGVSGGTNGNHFWPGGQQFYTASSGTSHSTPCVSGGCALLYQYFLNNFTNPPSPAMTKAYLMNSARYMNGTSANDTLWSDNQGMGEMNLGMAFDGVQRMLRDELAADMFTASGQVRTYSGAIVDNSKPFRVTVAWTDAPGATSGNAYNNNLDLTVTIGGNTYKGNVFSGAVSVTGGTADAKNNTESVFLPAGLTGNFTVTVTATSINSIGVPNSTNGLLQDFALVIYNGASVTAPVINVSGANLVSESCAPTNGVIDPGEQVTLAYALQNVGNVNTTNLVATLQTSGGVIALIGPQSYGALIAGGAAVSMPFTFTAAGTCGTTITNTFTLQDGATSLGSVRVVTTLGKFTSSTTFTQNFDGVTAPALPAGWVATNSGAQSAWVTSASARDSAPNSAFATDASAVGITDLTSPAIPIISPQAQLMFRNNYITESTYDGGVLEIKIGSGGFADILSAGGSFVSGGYNGTISTLYSNPLAGRSAWTGNSGGFVTTTVNLPAAAAGQNIQLKWRCGSDSSQNSTGWYIDTIAIQDGAWSCCAGLSAPTISNPQILGGNLVFTFSSVSGQSYEVQYKNLMADSAWTTVQTLIGNGSVLSVTNPASRPQRFFRIQSP
jgi:hypothetical protein